MKHYYLVFLLIGLCGCTLKPMKIQPSVTSMRNMSSPAVDLREPVKFNDRVPKDVSQKKIVGVVFALPFVLADGRDTAEYVAGIVGMKMRPQKVELTRCEMTVDYGMWMHRLHAYIAADVTRQDGSVVSFTGHGENLFANLTAENVEIAVNRALQAFEANVRQLPD